VVEKNRIQQQSAEEDNLLVEVFKASTKHVLDKVPEVKSADNLTRIGINT
jgi:hypothetical protein